LGGAYRKPACAGGFAQRR